MQPACEVFLGSKKLGDTPGDFADLPSGRQTFRLVNAAEGLSRTVTIDITPGGVTKKRFNFAEKGSVAFSVEPWADVYYDGKMLGKTPMRAVSFAPGKYEFRLVNDELKKMKTVTVEVRPGKRHVVKESFE